MHATSRRSRTPTATTFSDTGLTRGDHLPYRVRAIDAAGNLSGYSTIATATTPAPPDTTAADGADGLTATRGEHDPDQPELDGVDRQRRRDRLPGRALPGRGLHELPQVGTPTGTTFSDTG